MSTYLKIHSKINLSGLSIPDISFDYYRDEEGEDYPFEYFLEPDEEMDERINHCDEAAINDFQEECLNLIKILDEKIGRENWFGTNATGTILPNCYS